MPRVRCLTQRDLSARVLLLALSIHAWDFSIGNMPVGAGVAGVLKLLRRRDLGNHSQLARPDRT
jgi:hypothetical protein